MPRHKNNNLENATKQKSEKGLGSFVGILLGILANMRNVLYVYTTTLSAYLFYEAMTKDILFTLPVIGFLAISYIPLFYRRKND
jgi:hypothetical protein